MKKIMFNDLYGLTQAVLDGRKTMTRRIIPNVSGVRKSPFVKSGWEDIHGYELKPKYQIGEVVAIAMSYEYVFYELQCGLPEECSTGAGWMNKMFVKAKYMPYKIKITNIMVEQLQDISDDDCLKEGIWKGQVGSLETHFMDAYYPCKNSLEPCCTLRGAFEILINGISGRYTWDTNPFVYGYEFELSK